MPITSLFFRTSAYGSETEQVPCALVEITHPGLATPVRLSSDPTVRLSTDPLKYGTVSGGNNFEFVLMSVITPDDHKDDAPRARLVLENVEDDIVKVVRSYTDYATADIALVMSSNPDSIERLWSGMKIVKAGYNYTSVELEMSRINITEEPTVRHRMTRQMFPGLWH